VIPKVQNAAASRLVITFCSALLGLFGCTTLPDTSRITTTLANHSPELLSGVLLVGHEVSDDIAHVPSMKDLLALTPEMKNFARAQIRGGKSDPEQAERLLRGMISKQFFPTNFYTTNTLTASEVYSSREGNCLSYTNLYIALARHIGIDARYQIARTPPVWSSDSGFLVKGRHINVVIRDPGTPKSSWLTVDFNQIAADSGTPQRTVTDRFALSSFYNNLAIDHLYASRFAESLVLMRSAIRAFPTNADAWTNLAALYSSLDKREPSIAAYEIALSIDSRHESALTGLEQSFRLIGNTELAEHYHSVLAERRERDPYYHFALAQAAYANGDYIASTERIERAIKINRRPAGFYYIRGLAQYQLEDYENAFGSLTTAQKRERQLLPKQKIITARLLKKIEQEFISP